MIKFITLRLRIQLPGISATIMPSLLAMNAWDNVYCFHLHANNWSHPCTYREQSTQQASPLLRPQTRFYRYHEQLSSRTM